MLMSHSNGKIRLDTLFSHAKLQIAMIKLSQSKYPTALNLNTSNFLNIKINKRTHGNIHFKFRSMRGPVEHINNIRDKNISNKAPKLDI